MSKQRTRKSPRIDQLDANFRPDAREKPLRWLDAFDRRLALRGLAWLSGNHSNKHFRRLPDRAEKDLSQGIRHLSHCPAGVFLSFFTDSTDIAIRMKFADLEQMAHMPATGMSGAELFFRENGCWHPAATALPTLTGKILERHLMENIPRKQREYRLYLPLYKKVLSLTLGFDHEAAIEPAPVLKGAPPIVFYGTSVTQGGCANTAGSDYVSSIGRLLDTEVINLGFSGNGKGEPELARLIREIDAGIYVLDFIANAAVETLDSVLPEFIRLLRAKRPNTPIVLMGCPAFNQSLWNFQVRRELDSKRDITLRAYLNAKEAGDANIHFIDGNGLLPAGLTGAYVDGVHPTSHGFAIMAERLAPQLESIRLNTYTVPARKTHKGNNK